MNNNQLEESLKLALILIDSGDDEDSDPIDGLPPAVKNKMSDAEKEQKRAEARAGKEKSSEEIAERAEALTAALKAYVEAKIDQAT